MKRGINLTRDKEKPKYAPGIEDVDTIPRADAEDKRKGNVTVETRAFLDENDPSGEEQ
jgi:hypothetical protein